MSSLVFFLMIRRPPRSTLDRSSAASDVYKRQPLVSRPPDIGGLGFGMKWMMGWMHDTLKYFQREFIYRRFHQNDITFSIMYAFSENFMLPLSHDEVVHGKASLIGKMAGDEWQKFSNLRTLYGYMFTHPGTKLLFMGSEIGPYDEWNFTQPLPWELLQFDSHSGLQQCVRAVSYTHLRAHETVLDLVCRLLLDKKNTSLRTYKPTTHHSYQHTN